jgi:hypothetical protein
MGALQDTLALPWEPYRLHPNDSDPLGLRILIQDKELVLLISFNPDL